MQKLAAFGSRVPPAEGDAIRSDRWVKRIPIARENRRPMPMGAGPNGPHRRTGSAPKAWEDSENRSRSGSSMTGSIGVPSDASTLASSTARYAASVVGENSAKAADTCSTPKVSAIMICVDLAKVLPLRCLRDPSTAYKGRRSAVRHGSHAIHPASPPTGTGHPEGSHRCAVGRYSALRYPSD